MLASLADLGYAVEWRIINAADYGCLKAEEYFLLDITHQQEFIKI